MTDETPEEMEERLRRQWSVDAKPAAEQQQPQQRQQKSPMPRLAQDDGPVAIEIETVDDGEITRYHFYERDGMRRRLMKSYTAGFAAREEAYRWERMGYLVKWLPSRSARRT